MKRSSEHTTRVGRLLSALGSRRTSYAPSPPGAAGSMLGAPRRRGR